jgi:hypothetical protein
MKTQNKKKSKSVAVKLVALSALAIATACSDDEPIKKQDENITHAYTNQKDTVISVRPYYYGYYGYGYHPFPPFLFYSRYGSYSDRGYYEVNRVVNRGKTPTSITTNRSSSYITRASSTSKMTGSKVAISSRGGFGKTGTSVSIRSSGGTHSGIGGGRGAGS